MDLVNEFVVPRPIDRAWQVLTDVELIAPCLPGAQLTEVEGDVYRGVVKVKVGPILARFAGQAHFTERDEVNHRAVLDARGKEATGKGLASATVTAQLHDQGDSTRVEVTTQLTISGKIAQFGRGALADISTKLLDQFAERLEEMVLAQETVAPPDPGVDTGTGVDAEAGATGQAAPAEQPVPAESDGVAKAAPAPSTPPVVAQPSPPVGGVRVIEGPEAEPVNLLGAAGAPILKRLVPVLLAIVVIVVVILVIALN
ncbi:MAG TPA: SRPBCC domain-containing protein [Mycobacteriales bacterium]|nr:SRPBCC domain-containing protein [Mycobacteriales bacterium]